MQPTYEKTKDGNLKITTPIPSKVEEVSLADLKKQLQRKLDDIARITLEKIAIENKIAKSAELGISLDSEAVAEVTPI